MGGAQRDPRVRRVLVATGTGPGVGKTVVPAAIAALTVAAGCRVAVLKPAQTGVGPGSGVTSTTSRGSWGMGPASWSAVKRLLAA